MPWPPSATRTAASSLPPMPANAWQCPRPPGDLPFFRGTQLTSFDEECPLRVRPPPQSHAGSRCSEMDDFHVSCQRPGPTLIDKRSSPGMRSTGRARCGNWRRVPGNWTNSEVPREAGITVLVENSVGRSTDRLITKPAGTTAVACCLYLLKDSYISVLFSMRPAASRSGNFDTDSVVRKLMG